MNKLFRNTLFGSGSFVVVSLVGLITTPYFVYKLTSEVYGVYILLTSLVGYYGLVDLGLGQGVVKFVSENVARNQRKIASNYINAAVLVQFGIGLVVTTVFLLTAGSLVKLLQVPPSWTDTAILGVKLCSLGFLFSLVGNTFAAALQGLQRFDITSAIEASMSILLNGTLFFLLLLGFGIREMIYATTLSSVLLLIICAVLLKKHFPEWTMSLRVPVHQFVELFNFSFFVFVSRASNLFANYLVRYVVAAFAGPAAVTIFVVPSKLLGAIGGVLSNGAHAIFPYASELHTTEPSKVRKVFCDGARILATISVPITLFVILFSQQILTLWMGRDFADQSWMILSILSLSGLIASQSIVPNLVITGMGNSKTLGLFGLIALISYAIFLPLFTAPLGGLGAAIGMLCSTAINIGFVFYFTTKIVKVNLLEFLSGTFKDHLVPIFLMVLGCLIFRWLFSEKTWAMLMIGSTMLISYYAFLFSKEEDLIQIVRSRAIHYFGN